MNDKLKDAFQSKVQYKVAEEAMEYLLENTEKKNIEVAIGYFLAVHDQTIIVPQKKIKTLHNVFSKLKEHVLSIANDEWKNTIENTEYVPLSSGEKKEEEQKESTETLLINFLIETLITSTTAEIEKAIDNLMEETEEMDPRSTKSKDVDIEIMEEILENMSKLPIDEVKKKYAVPISQQMEKKHVGLLLKYIKGDLAKTLPLALYIHNPEIYEKVEKEFFRRISQDKHKAIEYFPHIDIDILLRALGKSSTVLKPLDKIIKARPVYREKIVEGICEYIKKGSRVKTLQFIKDNISYFLEKIDNLNLGCKEVLLLAERESFLLYKAFDMMAEMKSSLKDKKKQNYIQKEKKLTELISIIITQLGNLSREKIDGFIKETHSKDSELLSKVCFGLFRLKAPETETKNEIFSIVSKGSSSSFAFMVLPYLDEEQRCSLIEKYLVDEMSLSLFLRILSPESILLQAHYLPTDSATRLIDIAFSYPELFPDRTVSSVFSKLEERVPISPLLLQSMSRCLDAFPNMKPFILSIIKNSGERFLSEQKKELLSLLKKLNLSPEEIQKALGSAFYDKIAKKSKESKSSTKRKHSKSDDSKDKPRKKNK
ncbi:hypothetical protein NEFER03_0248 [Nematocida sp. LUAm3]|nr:hypothetical protein NEFER03_0248 [Nematocida sp. LUAm3]KAI5173701.1 hypothetical protein NEFER02_0217 [Nematocida sp. LUAm2]KAI5176923.1 hypothetical protein NEFER01_0248 [Nematocida sp. LUAm1]